MTVAKKAETKSEANMLASVVSGFCVYMRVSVSVSVENECGVRRTRQRLVEVWVNCSLDGHPWHLIVRSARSAKPGLWARGGIARHINLMLGRSRRKAGAGFLFTASSLAHSRDASEEHVLVELAATLNVLK